MLFNNVCHVDSATITEFDSAGVENFMELVFPWEVLLNESYEKLSDVSLDLLVVWRVKP